MKLNGHASETLNLGTMLGGGPVDAGDKELFLLYLARLGQLSSTERDGDRKHQSISMTEFRSLSRHRKLLLFHEVGLHASSLDTVKKFYKQEDPRYPDTHTDYATGLGTADRRRNSTPPHAHRSQDQEIEEDTTRTAQGNEKILSITDRHGSSTGDGDRDSDGGILQNGQHYGVQSGHC